MKPTTASPGTTQRQRIAQSYREALTPALRAPATWVCVAILLLAAAYLALAGYSGALLVALGTSAGTGLFVLLTIPLTPAVSVSPWLGATGSRGSRWKDWVQVGVVLLLVLLIYQSLLASFKLLPSALATIPVWTGLLSAVYNVQALLGIPPNELAVPLIYFVGPFAALLLLSARPGELGFARGYRAWRVAVLWSVLPLVLVLIAFAQGQWTLPSLLRRTIQTTLNSGPFEEFLFRGALMTRLARVLGNSWGIVLSGLAFGLLHMATTAASQTHGNLIAGAAIGLLQQGIGGLGFAIVVCRTRNLLATSIIHVISNVAFG
jgi:membrane protease YdiL (CAAX protease family)